MELSMEEYILCTICKVWYILNFDDFDHAKSPDFYTNAKLNNFIQQLLDNFAYSDELESVAESAISLGKDGADDSAIRNFFNNVLPGEFILDVFALPNDERNRCVKMLMYVLLVKERNRALK